MLLTGSPLHAVMLTEDAGISAENISIYTNGDMKLADGMNQLLLERGSSDLDC
ncbi:hypothetical protein GGR56DRAFT_625371 [Xylariaceae sp. FL0804]|nr:hypothetical protein GGR56DRAFT_625371 [Xylariaceae sp. FL0804]